MNKGKKLRFCNKCKRKRFCTRVAIPGYNYRITCSKGHSWIIKGITTERIIAAMHDVINSNKVKDLFNQNDTFFRVMKK